MRPYPDQDWAIWKWGDIPDLLDQTDIYMSRLLVVRTPFFGIQVHKIFRPDNDRHLHNHPRPFISVILKGGYVELVSDGSRGGKLRRHHRIGSIHKMALNQYHAIRKLDLTPTWTLVFIGKKGQEWGYITEDGFVHHRDYHRWRRNGII